jgi:hypothetical protein
MGFIKILRDSRSGFSAKATNGEEPPPGQPGGYYDPQHDLAAKIRAIQSIASD